MTPARETLTERIVRNVADRVPAARVFGGSEGIKESAEALREGRDDAGGAGAFARDIALALPHVPLLLFGLVKDGRVPLRYKASLIGAGVLAISPLDAVPDFIPGVGMLDDVAVVLLAVRWTLNSIDEPLLRAHWKGSDKTFAALLRIAGRATHPEIDVEHSSPA